NELKKRKNVRIRVGKTKKGQCIVERFNKTLARKLYRIQDANELVLDTQSSKKWVRNLQIVVNELNNTVTRLIGMKPIDAIKLEKINDSPYKPAKRIVGFIVLRLQFMSSVLYLLI